MAHLLHWEYLLAYLPVRGSRWVLNTNHTNTDRTVLQVWKMNQNAQFLSLVLNDKEHSCCVQRMFFFSVYGCQPLSWIGGEVAVAQLVFNQTRRWLQNKAIFLFGSNSTLVQSALYGYICAVIRLLPFFGYFCSSKTHFLCFKWCWCSSIFCWKTPIWKWHFFLQTNAAVDYINAGILGSALDRRGRGLWIINRSSMDHEGSFVFCGRIDF